MQRATQQTSAFPNPPPPSLPTLMAPFDLPANKPLFNFLVKNISARPSHDKPCGTYFHMSFWDSPEQYGTVKNEFAIRTYECMKVAAKMIAADPVLSASIRLQMESLVGLIGRDIFSRPEEFVGLFMALLRTVPEWSERDGLPYALNGTFSVALEEVTPLCLSDALEEAVYIGLLNAFGPAAHLNPAMFTSKLLVDVRSAAITSVTQTQAEVHQQLQQWWQSHQANPTMFKVQSLLQTARGTSIGTVPGTLGRSSDERAFVNNTLPGASRGRNKSLAGENVRRGLPQDGSPGFLLRDGDSEVYLREDRSTSAALNKVQAPPHFALPAAHGVKRTRSTKDTDDVFYDGDPDELTAKRHKPTVPRATSVHRPSLFQGDAVQKEQSASTAEGDLAMLAIDDDGVATAALASPSLHHFRDVDILESLERQAGHGHTEAAQPTSPILFQDDILTMADVEEADVVRDLEEHDGH